MNLVEAILSLHPSAVFGSDFVVSQTYDPKADKIGPDTITSWNETTLGQRDDAAIAAEVAKPSAAPAREANTYQLMSVFTDAERAAYANVKPWDQRQFSARATPWPETNEKVGRIAVVLGTTPKSLFDRALGA